MSVQPARRPQVVEARPLAVALAVVTALVTVVYLGVMVAIGLGLPVTPFR